MESQELWGKLTNLMRESEYTPLWEALKASNKTPKQVSVAANKALHPRIIKAVIKRKLLDIGFKLSIEPMKAILYPVRDGSKITFILEFFPEKSVQELKKESAKFHRFNPKCLDL